MPIDKDVCACVCVRGEREGERGLIRIKSNLAKTSNPQYRSFRAVRLLCKETARQRLTDLSLKPFYLMVAYSPGIQYAFMHDSSGNNLNYYSGRNHFRNTALWITFCLILLIPPSRFRLISSHPKQLILKLILSVQLPSTFITSFFSHLLYASKMGTLEDSIRGGDGPLIGKCTAQSTQEFVNSTICIALFLCAHFVN